MGAVQAQKYFFFCKYAKQLWHLTQFLLFTGNVFAAAFRVQSACTSAAAAQPWPRRAPTAQAQHHPRRRSTTSVALHGGRPGFRRRQLPTDHAQRTALRRKWRHPEVQAACALERAAATVKLVQATVVSALDMYVTWRYGLELHPSKYLSSLISVCRR